MGILEESGLQGYLKNQLNGGVESEPSEGYDNLHLKTSWGKLPVYPKVVTHFKDVHVPRLGFQPSYYKRVLDTEGLKSEFDSIKKDGGGVYAGFSNVDIEYAGSDLTLTPNIKVPYLPFFSVLGEVASMEEDVGWTYLNFKLKDGIIIKMAVSDGKIPTTGLEVSRTNFINQFPEYKTKINSLLHQTSIYMTNETDGYQISNLNSKMTKALEGKVVFASKDPLMDYAFCDYDSESGLTQYSYPSAWYTEKGVPIAHAVVIEGVSF